MWLIFHSKTILNRPKGNFQGHKMVKFGYFASFWQSSENELTTYIFDIDKQCFNKYFAKIGIQTSHSVPKVNAGFQQFMPIPQTHSMVPRTGNTI